ncbi:hypothetical protein I4U23_002117 [Adineta vaga]|nr:hypothetical protein I4U23_002117 [Adineta vaga]
MFIIDRGQQNDTQMLVNDINLTFNASLPPNNLNVVFREKVVLLSIDESFPSNINLNDLSVAFEPLTYSSWDLYREAARNTGGEYMLSSVAPSILSRAIISTITEGYTLRQAFLHRQTQDNSLAVNYSGDMNEQNPITDGVGDLSFDHGLG